MNNKVNFTIGILGGMGSYATLNFFKQILDAFPAEKEWDRPRIIIDNRCDMPSRVRAILYNENREKLIHEMSKSINMLVENGADYIISACNTSHVFLDEIYEYVPKAKEKLVHIIKESAKQINADGHKQVFLLATEGTIKTKIFSDFFKPYGIEIIYPDSSDFSILRNFIEAVKQNNITPEILEEFQTYINNAPSDVVILGCTELPVLYSNCRDKIINKKIYDPLTCALSAIKEKTVG